MINLQTTRKNQMKSNLLYIWQLPQNLLGLFVILFTQAKNRNGQYNQIWISDKYGFGVSLGKYIIFGGIPSQTDIQHEQGHQKQSYQAYAEIFLTELLIENGHISRESTGIIDSRGNIGLMFWEM